MNRLATAKDLIARAPRGLDAELEGYAWLPRMVDKARATLPGTAGSYPFGCCMARLGTAPERVLDLAARHTDDHAVLDALSARDPTGSRDVRAWTARRSRTSSRRRVTTCACARERRCRRPRAPACSPAPSTAPQ